MFNYKIVNEDENNICIRRYDEEYGMWVKSYIPKNKNDYSELNNLIKKIHMENVSNLS